MFVWTQAALRELLNEGSGNSTVTLLGSSSVSLYQNDLQPNPASVLGDYTIATFTGYGGAATTTFGPAFNRAVGGVGTDGGGIQWTATGDTTTNTIYGYLLQSGWGLVGGERFENPVPVTKAGDAVLVRPELTINVGS